MDYETLRLIWWALLGILLIGLAIMDGFDLGTAILLPFVGRTDLERRVHRSPDSIWRCSWCCSR
jgi:cytochrome d ubiquinol oxidase subunit II